MAPVWKDKKEEIRQLYLVQGLSLARTRREMERRDFYKSTADLYHVDPIVEPSGGQSVAGGDLAAYGHDYAGLFITRQVGIGATSLHDAVIHEDEEQVKDWLLQRAPIDVGDIHGNLPLHYALHHRSNKIAKLLLGYYEKDAEPLVNPRHVHSTLCYQDENGDTPLHLAISPDSLQYEHDESILTLLLKAGANPYTPNKLGISPVQKAVDFISPTMSWNHARHVDKMLVVRSVGLTAEARNSLFERFLERSDNAWIEGDTSSNSLFRDFLCHGADADIPTGPTSQRLLKYFLDYCYRTRHTWKNCDLSLAALICQKLDVTKVSIKRDTYLHELISFVGAWNYSPSMSELIGGLVKRKVDVNHLNADGKTPLMLLMEKRQLVDEVHDVLAFLLSHGADPWIPDAKGDFPVYAAVRNNPRMGIKLGKAILHANYTLDPIIACHDDWWQSWKHALILTDWDIASKVLQRASHLLPPSIEVPIFHLALTVLAEKYLQRATDWYLSTDKSPQEWNHHLAIVAGILTKSHGLDVSPQWFHYLLVLRCRTSM
ncbi:ankyrin repeat protein [Aspergillus clavatus NRRL 1]|uniref:Ankyrin repeat protein n=1 Tax=Aspergillus clavatus (strain ATCC 1007 / CBS 513.65 / DSM 816 / NCTC 3887 / NRRL 1 / QM 1276 / 107) TaxID=344612 RepID=A1CTN2_ASPCL|nr:Ankyrin repeat protein [Aspergillus clavatus NRRL 1]EAW06669.1 Ankyrin repeat protein [Aspergillus clavatus NRRL 1]